MIIESLSEFDRLRNDLTRAVCAISIIQTAMAEDVVADPSDAPEALFCVWERLCEIREEFSSLVDKEYTLRREKYGKAN